MGRIKDITGHRFGKLTVVKQAPRQEKRQSAWHCLCDCGQECVKRGTALRFGWVQSCGCMAGLARNPQYLRSFTKWFVRMYYQGARSRGLDFNLTEKQFMKIVQNPCHYCGFEGRDLGEIWYKEKIRRTEKRLTKSYDSRAETFTFTGNGVDRLLNEKPYSVDNCVACCTTCNMMKKALTEEEFLSHIARIFTHRLSKK
jgi:hypothetical protein